MRFGGFGEIVLAIDCGNLEFALRRSSRKTSSERQANSAGSEIRRPLASAASGTSSPWLSGLACRAKFDLAAGDSEVDHHAPREA